MISLKYPASAHSACLSPALTSSSSSPITVINRYQRFESDKPSDPSVVDPGRISAKTTYISATKSDRAEAAVCAVCQEAFHPISGRWPPKILPCGHNFCQSCLQSLCLYAEYYLLDSIRCPKCQTRFGTRTGIEAPNDFTLYVSGQENKKIQESLNVTVIHVGGNTMNKPTVEQKVSQHSENLSQPKVAQTKVFDLEVENSLDRAQSPTPQDPFPTNDSLCHASDTRNKLSRPSDTKSSSIWRCLDCGRRLGANSSKALAVISRFCEQCNGGRSELEKCNALTCLRCCVSKHNGHSLRTMVELEAENKRTVRELRQIQNRLKQFSSIFEQNVANSGVAKNFRLSSPTLNCLEKDVSSLLAAKRVLMRESQRFHEASVKLLSIHFVKSLPTQEISSMKLRHLNSVNRIQRMCSLVEKDERHTNLFGSRGTLPSRLSTASITAYSPCKVMAYISAAHTAIATLLDLYSNPSECDFPEKFKDLEKHMNTISEFLKSRNDDRRAELVFDSLKASVKLLNTILDERIAPEMLLLFESAFVHTFRALNSLSKCHTDAADLPNSGIFFAKGMVERRQQLWRLVQSSFGELLRIATLHWTNSEADRVELVGDIALMCDLFADSCDTATVLLCMIETARTRASRLPPDKDESDNAERIDIQLKRIDDHLSECRRIQKLNELRTQTRVVKKPVRSRKEKASEKKLSHPTKKEKRWHKAKASLMKLWFWKI
ncbi:RING-type zinc-finger domain-containing protein [Ditylenchus destructor]|nr:RING-type zinc-finger domain-containing protein [Ditylenchus destructor]